MLRHNEKLEELGEVLKNDKNYLSYAICFCRPP